MAKMFYTLEEAAQKLGTTEDEVRNMVSSNQLQEFRDGDKLMFKRDQVDLLAGGEEDEAEIPLAEDLEPGGGDDPSQSGSGSGLGIVEDTKDETGISIFDIEGTEEADPSAQTVMSDTESASTAPEFSVDPMSSGSGLLDLTQEADESSLGEDLLQDVYGEAGGDEPAAETEGALFESTGAESDVGATQQPVGAMQPVAPIDGTWSGISAGLAIGMILSVAAALALTIMVLSGLTVSSGANAPAQAGTAGMIDTVGSNLTAIAGGLAAVTGVFAIIGMVLGKKSA